MDAESNVNGLDFLKEGGVEPLPSMCAVSTGFPSLHGVTSVGSVTSSGIRSAFSNIGPITLVAPSNNFHELNQLVETYTNDYVGEPLIAAQNRLGVGGRTGMGIPLNAHGTVRDFNYCYFGGTSGAAPLVAGAIGLIRSLRPDFSSADVVRILQETAIRNLDTSTTFSDPNLQNTSGEFHGDRSEWFGSGLIDIAAAISST